MEKSFHPSLTLVPSLANYSLSLTLTGESLFHHTFPFIPRKAHANGAGGQVWIKYSGKYIEIYFNLKITFPIIQLPEYLISTISIIDPDGGMCNSKGVEAEGT